MYCAGECNWDKGSRLVLLVWHLFGLGRSIAGGHQVNLQHSKDPEQQTHELIPTTT